MKTPTGDGGEAPAGDDYGGEDADSRPVAGDGGEEDEQLLHEEEPQPAMEEEESASSNPATEGDSHGSPTSVEVEGTSVMRNGEEMGGEQPDLELRSRAVNNGGNGSSSPRDFNLDADSRPVAGDGGEEDEQLLHEEEPQPAMEEEESASSNPATEGDSHGSPTSVEVEGTSVMRNGEEMGGEQPDLELRSRAVNNGGNGSSSPRDFNLDEFLTLAHKVIDHGDSQAMDALNELKRRWEARFGIEKSRLPAKSLNVDEHPFARELKQVCRRRTTQATMILGTRMAATL
ncbi:uncharacterized protein LOC105179453 [Sesamum indicum]|uniref:Uncharacterized protein LOC105179453 n=1 Tax=Sesamum indicum TaxID=4182 RepID=A0A6I9V169_SESIN|nr:uncharacterized protein LOC105179453 [Sesamum indicum]